MDARKLVRGFGKTSLSAGILILLFVAYQLWGTGIAEARSQHDLKQSFHTAAPTTTVPSDTSTTAPAQGAITTTVAPEPATPPGEAVALIRIPKIGVDQAVVEGIGVDDLEHGPGHYPGSPLPGHPGNVAIAGHRTTYGAPFYRLNELKPGDDIFITTRASATPFDYRVVSSTSVDPSDTSVLNSTPDNRLTLTTCTPRFSATQRLIVVSMLVGQADRAPVAPTAGTSPSASVIPGDTPAAQPVTDSLSGKGASTFPGILWGLICAAVWIVAWLIGHRWRRWLVYLVATPVFLACLFVFFENTARFVPANI